ncbi:MAG: hypothetical protein HYX38_17595 [Rhodospirillales bacterium]|nr:hypothetical protein [Rhodospirillales bacterium]
MANTAELWMLLTNGKNQALSLVSAKVIGSSSTNKVDCPQTLGTGTYGGIGTPASSTPYQVLWTYTPDGGQTLLNFSVSLNGPMGLQIVPSKSGPHAGDWTLAESPRLIQQGTWLIRFYYT